MTARPSGGSARWLVAALALVGGCGGSGGSTTTPPSVPCGVSALGSVSVRRFCGTGSVSIRSGTTTAMLAGAECVFGQHGLTVNAGALVLGHPSGRAGALSYVGVALKGVAGAPGTADPAYRALVSADVRGRVISVTDAGVTLAAGGRTGSAQGSGKDGTGITVMFSC